MTIPSEAFSIMNDQKAWTAPWLNKHTLGTPVNIKYSFIESSNNIPIKTQSSFEVLSNEKKDGIRKALNEWSEVCGVTFQETSDQATDGSIHFRFGQYQTLSRSFYGDGEGNSGGDIYFTYGDGSEMDWSSKDARPLLLFDKRINDFSSTEWQYNGLHKIGHLLGFIHPDQNSNVERRAPSNMDNTAYTVLSLTWNEPKYSFIYSWDSNTNSIDRKTGFVASDTPMLFDIASAQNTFGLAQNDASKVDNRYTWPVNPEVLQTIWDASGSDEIDASNQILPCAINLNDGTFSSIGIQSIDTMTTNLPEPSRAIVVNYLKSLGNTLYLGQNNIAIGYGVLIENANGGKGDDQIQGNKLNNIIRTNNGSDQISGGGGDDKIDGGSDTDTAIYSGSRLDYNLTANQNSIIVSDQIASRDGNDILTNVEKIRFLDGVVAFDIQNTPDNALTYRLYQAAFARTPDEGGLRFWIDTHNKGVSINDIGSAFLNSAEFKQKYGANSTNSQLVDLLYKNILGREGEAGGVKYWNGVLDSGQSTKEQVLIGFAGSPENVAKTAANIDNGYWLV